MLLAEEEPDIDPYAEAEKEDEEADSEEEFLEEEDVPDPRAGRLVAEDEGAHPDAEADLVANDVASTPERPGPRRPPCTSSATTRTSTRSRASRRRRRADQTGRERRSRLFRRSLHVSARP